MGADTTQKPFENSKKLLQELLWFWISSLWPMIKHGSRSAQDMLGMLQLVKDKPKEWMLHVGVLRGTHHIVPVEGAFTVDTTHASVPENWKRRWWVVEEHKNLGVVTVRFADGEMYINDRRVDRYSSEKQKNGGQGGYDLRTELADKVVLPDAILDLLVREQDNLAVKNFLKRYKYKRFLFWGTLYKHLDAGICVRCLSWNEEQFHWDLCWLGFNLGPGDLALLLGEEKQVA